MRTNRTRIARLGLAALTATSVLAIAAPAGAQRPRQGTTPATCDMEVDGKIVQVPEGSRFGLFYCGSDGEWHLGWLVDSLVSPGDGTTKPPVVKTASAGVR